MFLFTSLQFKEELGERRNVVLGYKCVDADKIGEGGLPPCETVLFPHSTNTGAIARQP